MKIPNFYATTLKQDIDATTNTIEVTTLPRDENGNVITAGILVIEARKQDKHEIIEYTDVDELALLNCTRGLGGTNATPHLKNSIAECNVTGTHLQRLYDAFDDFVAENGDGWKPLVTTPTVIQQEGNRSSKLRFAGSDLTNILSKGMKMKLPRVAGERKSAQFNGTNQYARRLSAFLSGLNQTDDITIEATINIPKNNKEMYIASRRSASNNGWRFTIQPDGSAEIIGYTSAGYRRYLSVLRVPTDVDVTVTASLDVSNNTGRIYFDGQEVARKIIETSAISSFTAAGDFVLGTAPHDIGAGSFEGKMSEVRLWSTVRTPDQIRDNVGQPVANNTSGLAGYWKLDGDLNDSSVNQNHLVGAEGLTANSTKGAFKAINHVFIMTDPVVVNGNTEFFVHAPYGETVPQEALGNASYSTEDTPFGFPRISNLWEIYSERCEGDSLATNTTNYQRLTTDIVVPPGDWLVSFSATTAADVSSTIARANIVGLSTSTSELTINKLADYTASDNDTSNSGTAYYSQKLLPANYKTSTTQRLFLITSISSTSGLNGYSTREDRLYPLYSKAINPYL